MTATRQVVAVVVHYGDRQRTVRAVVGHWNLKVFSRIIVVANDLSEPPVELTEDICTWVIPRRNLGFGGACQLAATTCSADVYAFFNAHVTMDSASVRYCVAAFDIPDVGIGAKCVSPDHGESRDRLEVCVLHKDIQPRRTATDSSSASATQRAWYGSLRHWAAQQPVNRRSYR